MHQIRGAAFFDIDGTLVPNTTSGAFLAERLGHSEIVARAEEAYARGEIGNDRVCELDAAGFAGVPMDTVAEWLEELPLIGGIREAVGMCRQKGYVPYIASVAWTVVGESLVRRYGFEGCCGPQLEAVDGVFTGRVASYFDELGKRDYALYVCGGSNIEPINCIAIGDSRSDIPLFEVVGTSVALNATETARAAATTHCEGTWLPDAVVQAFDCLE